MTETSHETDVEFIRALAKVLRENDLTELRVKREYAEGETLNVTVSRGGPPPVAPSFYAPGPQLPAPHSAPSGGGGGGGHAPDGASDDDPSAHPGAVTSPMVGTAYLSPEPGTAPFVSIGDKVAEGQTVLIVEAMKTMNQIPAPRAGTVKRILIEDGAPVEFGAPLMIVE